MKSVWICQGNVTFLLNWRCLSLINLALDLFLCPGPTQSSALPIATLSGRGGSSLKALPPSTDVLPYLLIPPMLRRRRPPPPSRATRSASVNGFARFNEPIGLPMYLASWVIEDAIRSVKDLRCRDKAASRVC